MRLLRNDLKKCSVRTSRENELIPKVLSETTKTTRERWLDVTTIDIVGSCSEFCWRQMGVNGPESGNQELSIIALPPVEYELLPLYIANLSKFAAHSKWVELPTRLPDLRQRRYRLGLNCVPTDFCLRSLKLLARTILNLIEDKNQEILAGTMRG